VFAAGAGPGGGAARKDSVDKAADQLFAQAAQDVGVPRFVQISTKGIERADDPTTDPEFAVYLRAGSLTD